nr:excalibur calcium-binding domain-containing protein [Sedimenticola selenatireducens]
MKKIIVFAVICFGAWSYYQKEYLHVSSNERGQSESVAKIIKREQVVPPQIESRFRCDGRQYCSQMTSRAEAVFFIKNCPNTKMDGDYDGIPCERDSRF